MLEYRLTGVTWSAAVMAVWCLAWSAWTAMRDHNDNDGEG